MHFRLRKLFLILATLFVVVYTFFSVLLFYYGSYLIDESYVNKSKSNSYEIYALLFDELSVLHVDNMMRHPQIKESLYDARRFFTQNNFTNDSIQRLKVKLNQKLVDGSSIDVLLVDKDYVIRHSTYPDEVGTDFTLVPEIKTLMQKLFDGTLAFDISKLHGHAHDKTFRTYGLIRSADGSHLIQLLYIDVHSSIFIKRLEKLQNQSDSMISVSFIDFSLKINTISFANFFSPKFDMKKHEVFSERMKVQYDFIAQQLKFFGKEGIHPDDKKKVYEAFRKLTEKKTIAEHYRFSDGMYIHTLLMSFPFVTVDTKVGYLNRNDVFLVLQIDETDHYKLKERIKFAAVALWIFLIAMLLYTGYLIRERLLSPIIKLNNIMKIKAYVPSYLEQRQDEITQLSRSYNHLLKTLSQEVETNRNLLEEHRGFTANVLHQIRTPLSIMKITLDGLKKEDTDKLLNIESSIILLEHNFSALEYLSHSDHGQIMKSNFSQVLAHRIELFYPLILGSEKELVVDLDENIFIDIRRIDLEYLIDNNISNAVKYGIPYKPLFIRLKQAGEYVVLTIESYGKKIDNPQKIFERYERENYSKRGFGIGLHIVKSICETYEILIDVSYESDKNIFRYYFRIG